MKKDADPAATLVDLEAEAWLIGIMLLDDIEGKYVAEAMATGCGTEDFVKSAHATIFAAIRDLYQDRKLVSVVTVKAWLYDRGQLDQVGGIMYLKELMECTYLHSPVSYAARVRALSQQRRLVDILELATSESARPGADVNDLVASVRRQITEVAERDPIRAASIEGGLAGIEFVPASALGSGQAVDWLWVGWLARGFVTLLVGLWKAGKTTLLAYVLRATDRGGDIAGEIRPCKVLVVAEEGAALWARRRDQIGIADNVHFLIRPFKGRPTRRQWESLVELIAQRVQDGEYDIVVFDTWATTNPCDDENDAAAMLAALTPLHQITEAGAAILLLHHPRKGDAGEGQASRGTGALPGFVDIIVELRRYDAQQEGDRRRVLKGLSRFDETPGEVVLELRDDGYQLIGGRAAVKQDDRMRVIAGILDEAADPLAVDDLHDGWPDNGVPKPGIRTLRGDLNTGHAEGRWRRTGAGHKTDPYRYEKFDSGKPPALSAGTESGGGDAAADPAPRADGRARGVI